MLKRKGRIVLGTVIALIAVTSMVQLTGCQFGNTAKSEYKKGMKEFKESNYSEAADFFKEAVEGEPQNTDYHIAYGMSLIESEEYEEAQKQFDCAISDKEDKTVSKNNKKVYRGKGICYFFARNYSEAVTYFKMALDIKELNSLDLDILKYEGDAQCYLGNYEEAVSIYSGVIDEEQYNSSYYMKRAFAYGQEGETDKALEDYEKVIEEEPDNYDAYIQAFHMLSEAGKEDLAVSYLDRTAEIKDDSKEASYKKAIVEYYKEDTEDALEGLEEAVKNGLSEAGFYLGRIYFDSGDFTKAETYLELYLKGDSKSLSAKAYNLLGNCYYEEEKYKEALAQYKKGIALNEADSIKKLEANEIAAYERLGKFETALKKAKAYMEKYPDDEDMSKELEFIKTRLL